MTLHQTVDNIKKISVGAGIGIGGLIVFIILIRMGIWMKNILFPPPIQPPSLKYGKLPPVIFPNSQFVKDYTYNLNGTDTGDLPVGLPDRLTIFPIQTPTADLLNLSNAEKMVVAVGFQDKAGNPLQKIPRGNEDYEWTYTDQDTIVTRHIVLNAKAFYFTLTSDYLTKTIILTPNPSTLNNQEGAFNTTQAYLAKMALFPIDIDPAKTLQKSDTVDYVTTPELFDVNAQTAQLIKINDLQNVKVFRVDLYQKDVEYDLNTGRSDAQNQITRRHLQLPILYPYPPYSTMFFYVASGRDKSEVYSGEFYHQQYIPTDPESTYYIKTPEQAYQELQDGKAYIAVYHGGDKTDIQISSVELAYYIGRTQQRYLMPVYKFEGNNGFFAYVSAVQDDYIDYNSN